MRAPVKAGRRKQVRKRREVKLGQILPREESALGMPSPCASWGDPRREA
jgi:hypothetical protein